MRAAYILTTGQSVLESSRNVSVILVNERKRRYRRKCSSAAEINYTAINSEIVGYKFRAIERQRGRIPEERNGERTGEEWGGERGEIERGDVEKREAERKALHDVFLRLLLRDVVNYSNVLPRQVTDYTDLGAPPHLF